MKKLLLLICLVLPLSLMAQKKEKKKFSIKKPNIKIKKPNLRIGEKLGNLAGNLMTAKTDNLSETAPIFSIISGMYDTRTKTSEVKYLPKGTVEGDHLVMVTFMKEEGIGMMELKGEVLCNGKPMEYVGLGSYAHRFDGRVTEAQILDITTESGQMAKIVLEPIAEIEILSINDDATLPIIDLTEDLKIKYTNPAEYDNSTIKVGLLTDVAGARAFNYFADFLAKKDEVVIPHESFSNLEVSGALGAGNVNKGNSYLVLERSLDVEKSEIKAPSQVDLIPSVTISAKAYSSKPVIVKGKQENGVIATLRFSGGHKKVLGYDAHKPNARTGIPFSRASKFGLLSMTISGKTYKRETESNSSSHTVGGTRYTSSWTRTTTLEFPQLPDSYWETVMDDFYGKMTNYFSQNMSVDFVPVESITSAPGYQRLFEEVEVNTKSQVSMTYKNTLRASPQSIGEIFKNLSSSKSTENPTSQMMNAAGVDGLVTVEIDFEIGANKDNKIVLLPTVKFTISGIDETKNDKQGTYADGYITYREGVPFDADLVKSDPDYLSKILNVDNVISCLGFILDNLKAKEVAMGYDKIWNIGE